MNIKLLVPTLLLTLLVITPAQAQDPLPLEMKVQAYSVSDPELTLPSPLNCAAVIKDLSRNHQYQLVTAASLQGPPGVLFLFSGPRDEVVLLKCGTSHESSCGGDSHDEGCTEDP